MAKFRVWDSITIERVWIVDAEDDAAAIDFVRDNAPEPTEENQIDNEPYDAMDLADFERQS